MPVLPNPKWELAAQEVAKGKTQLEAMETAGYAPHDSNASRLIGNDKVKLRIRELQEQAAMSISITLEGQIAKLEDLLNQAKQHKQISAGVSAIDKQNELAGLKIQRVESKRGRVCEHERRRAKAICVWKQRQSVGLSDKAELFALTTRTAALRPDVIALCDEMERLARSATPPTVALQPAPIALHKPGCIECERRRQADARPRCSVSAQ